MVRSGGGGAPLREGYGLTESVTASMLMPRDYYREGRMGISCPDMLARWCVSTRPWKRSPGEEGEICVTGPTLMRGCLDDPEATAAALQRHEDGRVWRHMGDLGAMDSDGYFSFVLRMKRIIKTSGISVYPTQIEGVLNTHLAVRLSCVIGVAHPAKVQVPKGFLTLNEGGAPSFELEKELEHCRRELLPHSCPRCIKFREPLPLTLVRKVAYRRLEEHKLAGEKS